MRSIKQLDQALINKIAAGEVVERPVSVIKELVENAIDAGASVITVEIRDGGLSLIRVTDNGCGIPEDQVRTAFAQHATSKIENLDDLFEVMTLGFRGEALSSIASVAQVEMITKTPGAIMGTRIELHGGRELSLQAVGCVDGTTVIVSNLFFNTPARLKFLKKPATETGYISGVIQKLALGNPGLSFRLINNGVPVFQTNGNNDIKTAMFYLYGREISNKLVRVQAEKDGCTLDGYIGKPETARGNRSHGHFFINGRSIKSNLLQSAVEDAAKATMMTGKFPVFALYLSIRPDEVDVNVHPTKMEVRFSEEDRIFSFVQEAVRNALNENDLIPEVRLSRAPSEPPDGIYEADEQSLWEKETDAPLTAGRLGNRLATALESSPGSPVTLSPVVLSTPEQSTTLPDLIPQDRPSASAQYRESPVAQRLKRPSVLGHSPEPESSLSLSEERESLAVPKPRVPFFRDYVVLGLLFKTYWLVSQGESLYLIDQHAAHERVLYEDYKMECTQGPAPTQPLLVPVTLRLTPQEAQTLRDHSHLFEQFGFVFSDTGRDEFEINAVPFIFKGSLSPACFIEILDKLENRGSYENDLTEYKSDVIAMMACKAAVKANDLLNEAEGRALITRMLGLDNPFNCPHGRPTIIEITKHELERKFKRVT